MPKTRIDDADKANCGNCRFGVADTHPGQIICRANPPFVMHLGFDGATGQPRLGTQWPVTGSRQVCGQHETGEQRSLGDEVVVTVNEPEVKLHA